MNYIKRLACLVAFLCVAVSVNAQVKTADSIVHKLFTSLKNKDEKAFVTLYPNGRQMAGMMRGMMESMFKSPEMQQMMAMDEASKNMNIDSLINAQLEQVNKPEAQAEMQKGFAKSFQEIVEKGEKKGVNWSDAQLVSLSLDTAAQSDDEEMKMFAGAGVKNMKGVIDFRAGGTDYQMNFDKVLYIPSEGGWFGGEFQQVIKKGESFTIDNTTETVVEELSQKANPPPPPAPPAKTKSKTKTPAAKTKTKTKSKA